jgi:thiamine pyrophosphokinase
MVSISNSIRLSYRKVMKLDIKVDVLLGDFDQWLWHLLQGKAIPHEASSPDQDKTDLEKAFDYLHKGTFHCNVVWTNSTDHTITNLTNIVR